MTLTEDEIKKVMKLMVRHNIDFGQAMNYFLNGDYTNGYKNLVASLDSLDEIMKDVHD